MDEQVGDEISPVIGRLFVQGPSKLINTVVIQGRGLAAKDFGGKSDPYCILQFEDETFKTKAISNTLDPVWVGLCCLIV